MAVPIVLEEGNDVLLADGTKLPMPRDDTQNPAGRFRREHCSVQTADKGHQLREAAVGIGLDILVFLID